MESDKLLRDILQSLQRLERNVAEMRQLVGPFGAYLGNNRVIVQTIHGIKYVIHADDLLITPNMVIYRNWEAAVSNQLYKILSKDSIFLDIGANFGYFSCLAGQIIGTGGQGRVISIEPNPEMFALLQENININWSLAPVTLLPCAAGAEATTLKLHIPDRRAGNASVIADVSKGNEGSVIDVGCITVDSLFDDNVPQQLVVKIDVEGYELSVLKGMKATLSKAPNIRLLMEWSPRQITQSGMQINDVVEFMRSSRLSIYDIEADRQLTYEELINIEYTNIMAERH